MTNETLNQQTPRRGFLGMIASGAAAIGLSALAAPLQMNAQQKPAAKTASPVKSEADQWFNKIKGTHRVVYDATQPHEIFTFAWPKVFLMTNEATGSPASDCGVVVVLRHTAIGYALHDKMWQKYNLSELFKAGELGPAFQAADAATATQNRNPFLYTKPGDFKVPGFGSIEIGIPELQKSGVLFCACNAAMTVYSAVVAEKMNLNASEVLKEWQAHLIPGIQAVPSGVWALGRAQEHKCAYIFAG